MKYRVLSGLRKDWHTRCSLGKGTLDVQSFWCFIVIPRAVCLFFWLVVFPETSYEYYGGLFFEQINGTKSARLLI